ncbi:unnamed protein product [Staurois parvus]|uniref:Uncharacterized protein n=1 Tax=Staurois parvus TaxID=386267 RepID=A0ABN9F043_9NEOB|nr:unnamed protein product [Staurois parvus]
MGEVSVLQNLVGCQSGFASTLRKDTRGFYRPVCEIWWPRDTTCARHVTSLLLHLWDSPRQQVILQCWYVYDQDVLGRWCFASSPKGRTALVLALCCI